jgi:hypothetical protein
MVVLVRAAPGREAELIEWYDTHLREIVEVPGIASARLYEAAADTPAGQHFTIYEIDSDDVETTIAALRDAQPSMTSTDTLGETTVLYFTALGERITQPGRKT